MVVVFSNQFDFETELVQGKNGDEPPGKNATEKAGAGKNEARPALQEESHCEAGLEEGPVVACKFQWVEELRIDSVQVSKNTKWWQGFQIRLQAEHLPVQGLLLFISLGISFDKQ